MPKGIKNDKGIQSYEEHDVYNKEGLYLGDLGIKNSSSFSFNETLVTFLSLTDYNKILSLRGKEAITLSENEYAVVSNMNFFIDIGQQIIDRKITIELDDKKLSPISQFQQTCTGNNDYFLFFVVNDKYIAHMRSNEKVLNIQCIDEEAAEKFDSMLNIYTESIEPSDYPFSYWISKADIYRQSVSTKVIVSFLAIYLGIVFMITCAAILAIQQLSESVDNKYRYDLLKKLGADKRMLDKALFIQIACYFFLPLLLAFIHSIVGLTATNSAIKFFGKMNVVSSITVTTLFIVIIYGAYFMLTYMGSKNIINKG